MSYQFGTELKQVQDRINQFLANQFEEIDSYNAPLRDAMKYGLLLGGKRVRPFLVYATGKMLGAETTVLDYAAAAIEAIHAYSLIHDDLPAWTTMNFVVVNQLVISLLMKLRPF